MASQVYDAIIKGDEMEEPGTPASFNVFLNNLRGLGLDVVPRQISGEHEYTDEEKMSGHNTRDNINSN